MGFLSELGGARDGVIVTTRHGAPVGLEAGLGAALEGKGGSAAIAVTRPWITGRTAG